MGDRSRVRVGRRVSYLPTDVEATAGGGNAGDEWAAKITAVNSDGSVNLAVDEADGTSIAKTSVVKGEQKGQYRPDGSGPTAP